MSHGHVQLSASLIARPDQPLIAIPIEQDGKEEVRYFVDEAEADADSGGASSPAIKLAGVWSDLDGDAMLEALDRIRHESKPTSPIDLDL